MSLTNEEYDISVFYEAALQLVKQAGEVWYKKFICLCETYFVYYSACK